MVLHSAKMGRTYIIRTAQCSALKKGIALKYYENQSSIRRSKQVKHYTIWVTVFMRISAHHYTGGGRVYGGIKCCYGELKVSFDPSHCTGAGIWQCSAVGKNR